AIGDHRDHRVANRFFADLAEAFSEAIERHHSLGHGAVTAGAADVVIEPLHDVAGALDVADIAHTDHHAVLDQARGGAPLDAFDLQAKRGHLGNHVLAIDLAQVNYCHAA